MTTPCPCYECHLPMCSLSSVFLRLVGVGFSLCHSVCRPVSLAAALDRLFVCCPPIVACVRCACGSVRWLSLSQGISDQPAAQRSRPLAQSTGLSVRRRLLVVASPIDARWPMGPTMDDGRQHCEADAEGATVEPTLTMGRHDSGRRMDREDCSRSTGSVCTALRSGSHCTVQHTHSPITAQPTSVSHTSSHEHCDTVEHTPLRRAFSPIHSACATSTPRPFTVPHSPTQPTCRRALLQHPPVQQ